MTSEDDVLSYNIDQAAVVTGMGRSALYVALREGRLTGRKAGRRLVILKCELERFLSALPPAPRFRRPSEDHDARRSLGEGGPPAKSAA